MLKRAAESMGKREPAWRRIVGAAGVLILLACAFRALTRVMDGDFKLHWEFGRRFLAGEFLYSGGLHLPYPPFWAMAHAPAAFLSLPMAKALLFPIGVAALFVLLRTLRVLAGSAFPLPAPRFFWVAAGALFLAGRYVIRDLAELGVNTALVALTWLAIHLWRERRAWLAGTTLGFAIALKCTPVIFAGYFLWKRQWRMFATSSATALLFTLAPILWQGPASYRNHIAFWSANVWQGFGNANPSVGVLGPEPVQNMALRPSLARYLMGLPAGHPGRTANPLYADVFALSPVAAGWVIKGVMLALLAFFLWWSRRAIADRHDARLLWELAALSILMLLFSPITWGQHCVALLPACYFIAALWSDRGKLPHWMLALIVGFILFVPVLSRDVVGRDLAYLLASYHVETFAILGLFAILVGARRLKFR
ncbi:MAG: glycosyltransferase family 87 protein [Chthoniobacterales bacterium]